MGGAEYNTCMLCLCFRSACTTFVFYLDHQRMKSYPSPSRWLTEMACLVASVLGTGKTIHYYHIAQLFDEENIDGQHPRPPVLAIATGDY